MISKKRDRLGYLLMESYFKGWNECLNYFAKANREIKNKKVFQELEKYGKRGFYEV